MGSFKREGGRIRGQIMKRLKIHVKHITLTEGQGRGVLKSFKEVRRSVLYFRDIA